jgi:hypothetical protein
LILGARTHGGTAQKELSLDSETGDVSATSFGGVPEANLVDKSATEIITGAWSHSSASFGNFKIKRASTTSAAIKYENNNGIQGYIGFLDGGTFRVWDNVIGTVMSVTSAGAMTLASVAATGAVTGSNLNVSNWDTAFGWGDHSTQRYLDADGTDVGGGNLDTIDAASEMGIYRWGGTQPVTGSPGFTYGVLHAVRDNNQMIQLAYGGASGATKLKIRRFDSGVPYAWVNFWNDNDFSTTDVSNWNTAFGWGDHASGGYAPTASPTFTGVPVTPRLDATSQYIEMRPTSAAGPSGIYFKNNAGAAQGYVYASGAGQFGLLHSGGGWAVQIASGSPNVSLLGTVTTTGAITEAGTSLASKYLGISAQAADSALLTGLGVSGGSSPPSGSQIIKSHTNGYTYLGWINTVSGATASDPTRIYVSTDAFIRYMTPANFIDFLQGEDWGFTTEVKFNTLSPQASVGFIGNYSDTGTSTWGGTIWAMDESFNAAVGGANSANTSCYGIRWLRASHTSAQSPVGEGLYVYQNGVFKGGIGSAGIYAPLALRVDGNFDLNGNILGDGASTISGIETIAVDSTGDITKSSHGNYLYHKSTAYDNDQNGEVTFSTSAASGGTTGDIWFQYTA